MLDRFDLSPTHAPMRPKGAAPRRRDTARTVAARARNARSAR